MLDSSSARSRAGLLKWKKSGAQRASAPWVAGLWGLPLLMLVLLAGTPAAATTWKISELPFSYPTAINDAGQVVGVHRPGEDLGTSPSTTWWTSYF